MSCYFPIDFSPPKGSEMLVTKEELILGLRNSLSHSGIFAPLAMPLYLEKLDSDLTEAKIDANLTLIQSLQKYSPAQIKPHLDELWSLLKKEILGIKMNVNEEVHKSCHDVIFHVTLSMSKSVQTQENREIMEKWLGKIWADVGRHLKDIELKFMSLSIEILKNVISTSAAFPSTFMLEKSMPILIQVHSQSGDLTKKAAVLHFMSEILYKSAEPGKLRPKWYDDFLHASIEGLASKNFEMEKCSARALVNGGHFIEKINAEQILDSVLLSDHFELIEVLIKRSQGSRPNENDLQNLFSQKKSDTLAIIYKNEQFLERDLGKILSFINEDFGLELLSKIVLHHPEMKNEILEKMLREVLVSSNSKKVEFLSGISPRLDGSFAKIIPDLIEMNEDMIKAFICYSSPELINR